MKIITSILISFCCCQISFSQELGTVNTTFGIIAYDTLEKTWGCAFATNNLAIGQPGVFEIKPNVGIIASIAFTNPDYPKKGIPLLEKGYSVLKTFDSLRINDELISFRQLGIIDKEGNTFGYTGYAFSSLTNAGTIEGKNYVILGNSLADTSVLTAMAKAFEATKGPLYLALFNALIAGENSGGQKTGKLSAVLCVKREGESGFNEVDFRVDFSQTPFKDLQVLVNKKLGIELWKKVALQNSSDSACLLLDEAFELLRGWTILYPELAYEYYKLGFVNKAIGVIERGLEETSNFKYYLPSFYFLSSYPKYQSFLENYEFTFKDWLEAIFTLIEAKEFEKARTIATDLRLRNPESSYLIFLLGKAYEGESNYTMAVEMYEKAYSIDNKNIEAKINLEKLKKK